MNTDILIVGGGLAGLSLADHLQRQGRDFALVEARSRLGGRIKTEVLEDGYFDMGPAWFWPGQPRIAALIHRLGLQKFDQHCAGILTFEDEKGQVQRGRGHASMQGSYRLNGGLGALIAALADQLPPHSVHLNTALTGLEQIEAGVRATLNDGRRITAQKIVLALPPRVIAAQIEFTPVLPKTAMQSMADIPTWMAGQAKAIAVYDTAFWREEGLSGDAMSRCGPMVEIHDASPAQGGPYALFGFVGLPPTARKDEGQLRDALLAQFQRLFGPKAANPRQLYVKDWAFDQNTATPLDQAPLYAHPQYGLPHALKGVWDNRVVFGGTEVAPQFGGYLEGALEAGENVVHSLGG
ncbi:MAG: flavin monoamine oxidase family protein [Sedimentitalea sp.]